MKPFRAILKEESVARHSVRLVIVITGKVQSWVVSELMGGKPRNVVEFKSKEEAEAEYSKRVSLIK